MKRYLALSLATLATTGVLGSGPAFAAQQQQTGTCDGVDVTIRTPDQNSSDHGGWTVGQVVDGNGSHLIPTSFTLVVTDTETDMTYTLFSSVKGNGNANHNQQQVTCSFPDTDPADAGLTIGNVEEFMGRLPGNPDPKDPVTLAFQVTAVPKTK